MRTPDEALRESGVRMDKAGLFQEQTPREAPESIAEDESDELSMPPVDATVLHSPPLPPLPPDSEYETEDEDPGNEEPEEVIPQPPSRPLRAIPPTPPLSSLSSRPSLMARSHTAPIPALEGSSQTPMPYSPLTPAFNAILLSDLPRQPVDRSRVLVTLETCTATYRTTLDTLTSRPSHLASYVESLLPPSDSRSSSSVYSTNSDDIVTAEDAPGYRRHLASQGLVLSSAPPTAIHVFLDRPSAP